MVQTINNDEQDSTTHWFAGRDTSMSYSRLLILTALLALTPLLGTGQPVQIKLGLTVRDAADTTKTIYWGVDPVATFGIDSALMEEEQPPFPPSGVFELRWTNPSGHSELGQGLRLDLRTFISIAQTDTYRVRFQPSVGGYPMTLKWSRALVSNYYGCGVRLKVNRLVNPIDIDMTAVDSVVITDLSVTSMTLIAGCPTGPSSITGKKYEDTNGNGIKDAGEPGIPGWKIYLGGSKTDSTLTDANGAYRFENLLLGTYSVTEEQNPAWVQTSPAGGSYTFSFVAGTAASGKDFGNFRLGRVAGFKFEDLNANSVYDNGEALLPGWTIKLGGASIESTLTDAQGKYAFSNLGPGSYTIKEVQSPTYVQLKPSFPGFYSVTMTSGKNDSSFTFGNKIANAFTGSAGAEWSNPSNWSSGQVPSKDEVVVIQVPVTISSLPHDTVIAIRIAPGASILYATADRLVLLHSMQIDSGSSLTFSGPAAKAAHSRSGLASQSGIDCYGSWINNGSFDPGTSLITFVGDTPKVIGGSVFYDLSITGSNTSSSGDGPSRASSGGGGGGDNIVVSNTFNLGVTFHLKPLDTLVISNPSPDALTGTGIIPEGTILRAIEQGNTSAYRFESPSSFITFNGIGTYPSSISMTAVPGDLPPSADLKWKVATGSGDQSANTVTAFNLSHFSLWGFGTSGTAAYGLPRLNRHYEIHETGGSGYNAELSLRYEQTEVPGDVVETDLKLLYGPYYVDTVRNGWNMISLPVIPDVTMKDAVFGQSVSNAFAYNGLYVPRANLEFGQGYWLKFSSNQEVQIAGLGNDDDTLSLVTGWNLIGAMTHPVSIGSISMSSPDLIQSQFYHYDGSYKVVNQLNPLRGYWVKAGAPGSLILHSSGGPLAKGAGLVPPELLSLNALHVSDASGNEQILYYGAADGKSYSRYELPPPPPEGSFDVRYRSQRMVELSDARSVREIPVQVSSDDYPVTIRWEGARGIRAILTIGATPIDLRAAGSAVITDGDTRITLRLSPSSGVAVPKEFALLQNYPNPFNPSTRIEYALPREAQVRITVYNILGQQIDKLVEGVQQAGNQSVEWNAVGVSSGVYFYRIEASTHGEAKGSFVQVRKMMLLR